MTVKKFRPSWLLTAAALAAIAATASLAAWQFDRAAGKKALEQSARAGLAAAPLRVRAGEELQPFRRAVAIGRYLPNKQILLDNRVHQRRAGYHVITPLLLDDGLALAVNRGWLVAGKNRATPPVPVLPQTGRVTVRGVLTADETGAFVLSPELVEGRVWQKLHLADYGVSYGLTLANLVLLRDDGTGEGEGLSAVSVRVDFKSARSVGYAWQWLTFALLAAVFYVILGRRKR